MEGKCDHLFRISLRAIFLGIYGHLVRESASLAMMSKNKRHMTISEQRFVGPLHIAANLILWTHEG